MFVYVFIYVTGTTMIQGQDGGITTHEAVYCCLKVDMDKLQMYIQTLE